MTQQQPPFEPTRHPQREHCTKEGLCSWTFDFKGKPCNKNCSSDSRKKPSEYRCETCDNSIIGKDQDGYTHRHCKHPEMQYRGSDSILLLGTEITHIQDHGCMLHPKMAERIAILEANIERKDNDIVVLTTLCASQPANTGAQARIDAVVKELEEIDRLVPAGPYCVGSESLVYIHVTSCQKIHTAIALLKEGVGKC